MLIEERGALLKNEKMALSIRLDSLRSEAHRRSGGFEQKLEHRLQQTAKIFALVRGSFLHVVSLYLIDAVKLTLLEVVSF